MAIALRLSRGGAKKRPYYRIVAADNRRPRDGKYLEQVGTYNPLLGKDDEKRVQLNEDRIRYWLGVGAQPSDRVLRFLDAAGIREREARNNPNKGKPGDKANERAEEREAKGVAAAEAAKEAEETAKAAEAEAKEAVKKEAEEAKAADAAGKESPANTDAAVEDENLATGSLKSEHTAEAVADAVADEVSADATAQDAAAIAELTNEAGPVPGPTADQDELEKTAETPAAEEGKTPGDDAKKDADKKD